MRRWFLCIRRPLSPRVEWLVTIEEHVAWMSEQHEQGSIFLSDATPDQNTVISIIHAATPDCESDPFTTAGHGATEIREWQVAQIASLGGSAPE